MVFRPHVGFSTRVLGGLLLVSVVVTGLFPAKAQADPITWMEDFALADDREQKLAELIPGTDDFYFYHCLHYQISGQLERSETVLRDWLAENKGKETPAIAMMIDRQRLLAYQQSPQRTIDHLVRRLGIKLDHPAPATKNERRFPSQFDAAMLQGERLVKEALQRNDRLKPLGMQLLAARFLSGNTAGYSISLRDFLNRVDGPFLADLDQLVIKELQSRRPNELRFGDLKAHNYLTLAELDAVAEAVAKIAENDQFVAAKLRRMRPSSDQDLSQQTDVRYGYLERVEAYLRTLPASYNSMKAAASFRLLEANLSRAVFDRDLLMRYLELPRTSPIVSPDWIRRGGQRANLNQDFMSLAMLPPVGNEEPVVRQYLEHFLRDAESYDAFAQVLKQDYLIRVFAETKLLNGVGSEDRWYKMLSASQRQSLRDAVQIRLSSENANRFKADEPTELLVDIKNVDELVIRIYEINTASYYRTHSQPIDTSLDLDGLVATHERKIAYTQPAVERHREKLALSELEGRGVWIVDLVGKGVRARALVRRGSIDYVQSEDANGMVFTIIDENRNPIPTATMWVGSREFSADDDGRIRIPPVSERVDRRAIINDGEVAEQVKFRHLRESYRLVAGMHLDRTLLQTGGEAELLIRPQLFLGNTPIAVKTLTDVTVTLSAMDMDGLPTTRKIDGLTLSQAGELVVPLRVPTRLSNLSVTLTGKIDGLSDSKQRTLRVSRKWDVAGIRRTSHAHDVFLTRDGDGFVLEVRGRNGELIPRATVSVQLTTDKRAALVEQTLQSDEEGRVQLGALEGATYITYSVPGGVRHERDLILDRVRWPDVIHTASDRPIRLPLVIPADEASDRYRLIEVRDGSYHIDVSDKLTCSDGLLSIGSLNGGDFHLIDRAVGTTRRIVVVDGPVRSSVATGMNRHRELSPAVPLGIASITRNDDGLKIELSGDTKLARVHIYGSRFLDQSIPIDELHVALPSLDGRRVLGPRSAYVSDLRLGDEYQYVLRRKYANKYPGVMLPQPSLILNPWATEETSNQSQTASPGQAVPGSARPSAMPADEAQAASKKREAAATTSDFDFLADPGVVLANLEPDENGVVTVPADAIEGLPNLQIVACDPATILQRFTTGNAGAVETVDLRLAKSLAAENPYSFDRGVSIASKDQPLDLKSLGSAQLQVYASVADLWNLYKTLVKDSRMGEFDVLAKWNYLDDAAKLDTYSRLASHELHLFLFFHDRSFFDQVVAPYLANKKEKQFIDAWLLDESLDRYTSLWRYNQLNAAERALLAMRVPDLRDSIVREMREAVDNMDENFAEVRRGIESALKASRFEVGLGERPQVDAYFMQLGVEAKLAESEALSFRPERGRRRLGRGSGADASRDGSVPLSGGMFGGRGGLGGGGGGRAFFRNLDSTKQWAESHWDRVRPVGGPAPASLIDVNDFWHDVAQRSVDDLSVSDHLLRPVSNRHATLVALAMCGLPLSPGDVGLPTEPDQSYAPEHAVAVVTKRLQRLEIDDQPSSILIGQRFESVQATNRSKQSVEPNEYLIGQAYRGHVVVSNPTAQQRVVDVFWQMPAGSLPLAGKRVTDSQTIVLKPFAVSSISYEFYFPAAGDFSHYPATVASDGKLVAQAELRQFDVLEEPTAQQTVTWERIAAEGDADDIQAFLQDANLRDLNWTAVAHRMKDAAIYKVVTSVLNQARIPASELWAYGFFHRDESAMKNYLSMRADLAQRTGPVLKSPLLEVEPIERRYHELLEYAPLVRARIHRLGQEDEILNAAFYRQYESFVRMLGFSADIPANERLVLSYYLLIQNRIAESIEQFQQIDRANVVELLQYDYLDAYLALHQAQYDRAGKIASRYANHPIPRWNQRFANVTAQLRQQRDLNHIEKLVSVEKKPGETGSDLNPIPEGSGDLSVLDRERRQAAASDEQPEVIVRVEGDALRIDHRRSKDVVVNFYGVDLELLFSKAPFVREDLQRMAMVRPSRSEEIRFDASNGVATFDLDDNLRRQTLLVEVVAGASRSTALYYGGDMTTYVSDSYGQLQASDASTGRPIDTAYVKVYAKYPNGQIRFYKDGYTDARGRFDYASISAAGAQGATRFAILVLSEEKGATLHDVSAPNQ